MRSSIAVGYWLGAAHLFLFAATVAFISLGPQGEGWKSIAWVFWLPVDFPLSLLHYVLNEGHRGEVLDRLRGESKFLQVALYSPYLIHGLLGTIWWTCLPRIWSGIRRASRSQRPSSHE